MEMLCSGRPLLTATCDIDRNEETDDAAADDDDAGVGDVADIVFISDVMMMAIAQMSFLDSIYLICIYVVHVLSFKQ